ncbi:MAG: hypothetical protein Q8Q00_00495 [Dehalococcoidia bacterium]|nr:hypothetical protein [Dehalococcoidia bacterium]
MGVARLAAAAVLVGIAGFFAFLAGVIISKVFAEYKDNADAVYIAFGSVALAISALFAAAALLALAPGRHPQGWLVLALVAAVASALPYAEAMGNTAFIVNGVLAALAIGAATAHLRAHRN